MRKLFIAVLLLSSLIVACDTKTPTGPGKLNVEVTTTTSSSTTTTTAGPTTSSSTSTTTSVVGGVSRRYLAFNPPPNIPADMTLFFELILQGGATNSLLNGARSILGGRALVGVTENEYNVTGVYVMGNGTTGQVQGELGDALNPLESGGIFEGSLTARPLSGCNAERQFGGTLTSQTLQWNGGAMVSNTCATNPLDFNSLTMLQGQGAPLPTTTTVTATTTTTTCTYSLTPAGGATAPAAGGVFQITINTTAGCAWTAQSFADWITVNTSSGSGPATITYNVQQTSITRSGNILVGGLQFQVSQAAPLPDLIPEPGPEASCTYDSSEDSYIWRPAFRNAGTGAAGTSTGRMTFLSRVSNTVPFPAPVDRPTPALGPGASTFVTFPVDRDCFVAAGSVYRCSFRVTADQNGSLTEASEANNSAEGSCTLSSSEIGSTAGAISKK